MAYVTSMNSFPFILSRGLELTTLNSTGEREGHLDTPNNAAAPAMTNKLMRMDGRIVELPNVSRLSRRVPRASVGLGGAMVQRAAGYTAVDLSR
jgi:hypothetical protein